MRAAGRRSPAGPRSRASCATSTTNRSPQLQLVENLQRVDLNPLEIARALEKICQKKGDPCKGASGLKTRDDAGQLVGRPGTWVTRHLRLLDLPVIWHERLLSGEITMNKAIFLARHANAPPVLARIESDMIENPWAYRSQDDFERNVTLVAEDAGFVRKAHGNTKPKPPTQRPPRVDAAAPSRPVRDLADDVAGDASLEAAGDAAPLGPSENVAAIVAAVAKLEAADVELVLEACLERRAELAARATSGEAARG